jgi:hypothetical protein
VGASAGLPIESALVVDGDLLQAAAPVSSAAKAIRQNFDFIIRP